MKGYATLKELGAIITGNTPKTSETENYDSNDIPFVKPSDLHESDIWELTSAENHISEKARGKARIAPSGTVLCTCIGIIGKIGIVSNECAFNQQINAIIPDTKKVIPHYLAYAISSKKNYMQEKANAAVVPIINKTQFGALSIQTPSLDKQRNIVNVLFSLEALISNRQQALSLLNTLVKSRFIEMFGDPVTNPMGWEVKKLSDICVVGSSKRVYQSEQTSMGVPFLRISDLVSRITTQKESCDLHIPEELFNKFEQQGLVPKAGDILVTARGTLGLCYIIKPDDRFYFQDGMISWVHTSEAEVNPVYISYLFDSQGIRRQIDSVIAGSTVAYLSIAQLGKFDILMPPIDLQNQFADFVALTDKSKFAVQRSIDTLQTLKAKLMQEYFG